MEKPWQLARPSVEVPNCYCPKDPILVCSSIPTPAALYLSNLDGQPCQRFTIKYIYVFRRWVAAAILVASLSKALVEYYSLAGRLIRCPEGDGEKLVVNCNAQGGGFSRRFTPTSPPMCSYGVPLYPIGPGGSSCISQQTKNGPLSMSHRSWFRWAQGYSDFVL